MDGEGGEIDGDEDKKTKTFHRTGVTPRSKVNARFLVVLTLAGAAWSVRKFRVNF